MCNFESAMKSYSLEILLIKSLTDFVEFSRAPNECDAEYGCPNGRTIQEIDLTLYRGQSNDWPVLPSIGRKPFDPENEKTQIKEFLAETWVRVRNRKMELFEALALMQHLRVHQTRLLDWTKNALVALYFAIADNPQNPVLWKYVAEGHHQVGRESHGPDGKPCAVKSLSNPADIDEIQRGGKSRSNGYDWRWPLVFDPRDVLSFDPGSSGKAKVAKAQIRNQESRFVLWPSRLEDTLVQMTPMDWNDRLLDNDHICKGAILQDALPELRDHLDSVGINREFIYPLALC